MNTPAPISQQAQQARSKAVSVVEQFRSDLARMESQFKMALPAHIPVERFTRVVMTAIQNNPKLLNCSRQSLFNACMRAAADGLLPDGREGAIVPFGEGEDGRGRADTASWMPMIAGIRKKARNSGEIADWYAEVVHDGDEWVYRKGDRPALDHTPGRGSRTRPIIAAYSVCHFKDGTISREWMWIEEIEDIRKHYSRSKKGPWSDPVAYPEMCKKTVARLHSKTLPMSTDLDDLIRRDDELYDLKGARERNEKALPAGRGVNAALEHFGGGNGGNPPLAGGEGGEGVEPPLDHGSAPDAGDPRPGDDTVIDASTSAQHEPSPGTKATRTATPASFADLILKAEKHPPANLDTFRGLILMLTEEAREIGGKDGQALLTNFWAGTLARTLRNKAGLTKEDTDAIAAELKPVIEEMGKA